MSQRRDECDRLARRRAEMRESIPHLREAARAAAERARVLSELATSVSRIPQWTDEASVAREIVSRAAEEAETAEASAMRWRELAAEDQRRADGHHRTATSARAELAEVPGGGSVGNDEPIPGGPVELLRTTFAASADAFTKVEVGNDLRAELDHAEHAEATARAQFEALDRDVCILATKLIETSDGSDAAARVAAEQRADRALAAVEAERAEAIGVLATRRAEFESLPAAPSALDGFDRPSSVTYGMQLIATAGEELFTPARALDEVQASPKASHRRGPGTAP